MRLSLKKSRDKVAKNQQFLEVQVELRTAELKASLDDLEKMSRTDPLTGLPNRRDILEKIQTEKYRVDRTGKPFALLMIDIDHFKQFNDEHGHACGDEVLKVVSKVLLSLMRKHDFVSRWGGEEFLLALPETSLEGGKLVADRICKRVSREKIPWKEDLLSLTVTIGVALYNSTIGVEKSIDRADQALYLGKRDQRNCVKTEEDLTEEE